MESVDLFSSLPEIEGRLEAAVKIGLFLDFDGTIAPIVPRASDAALLPGIKPILAALVDRGAFEVGIVTGRALEDVRMRMAMPGLFYSGNHGLEIEYRGRYILHPGADAVRPDVQELATQLEGALGGIDGVEIEEKAITLSVHYRQADPAHHPQIARIARELVSQFPAFLTKPGKRVVEVRPRLDANKGTAVRYLVRELLPATALPIYIGDDISDEDAFAAIPAGITVRVGEPCETGAQYQAADVSAVCRFLDWLARTTANASIASLG